MLCVLFFCVNLWEKEGTLDMRLGLWDLLWSFFSHRTHRSNRAFLRTVSISQNTFGIQNSQSVTANEDTNKEAKAAYIQPIGVSRWSLPFPSGEGTGEGPLSSMSPCVLFFCVNLWERERTHSVRWYTSNSLGTFISHRAHRVHGVFGYTFRAHKGRGTATTLYLPRYVWMGGSWAVVSRKTG